MRGVLGISIVLLGSLLCACEKQTPSPNAVSSYNPKAAAFNVQLGLGYLKNGQMQRAKSKLLMALSEDPNNPEPNGAMAYYLETTGDLPQAEVFYKKAMSLSGKGPELNNYGTFLCRHSRYVEAQKYFMQAVSDLNYLNTAGAYENAGLCALANHTPMQAAHYFQKALEQDPRKRQSLFQLSKIYYEQKKYTEAALLLQRFDARGKTVESEQLGQEIAVALEKNKN